MECVLFQQRRQHQSDYLHWMILMGTIWETSVLLAQALTNAFCISAGRRPTILPSLQVGLLFAEAAGWLWHHSNEERETERERLERQKLCECVEWYQTNIQILIFKH